MNNYVVWKVTNVPVEKGTKTFCSAVYHDSNTLL